MTKDAISDFSVTANSNTDIIGVNIDEGCPPSSLNNGIRALMKTLADLNAGNSSLGTLKVDNLQLDANAITSTDTNGNITITPHGTGSVVLDGISHPTADGAANTILTTNGSGVLSFSTVATASIANDAVTADKLADSINSAIAANTAKTSNVTHTGDVTGATSLTIADNAVTLAKMAGGTDGNIISYDASGDPVAVATGSAGQVLTSAGAGAVPTFADAGGGATAILAAVTTPSNGATIEISIPTGYNSYILDIGNWRHTGGGSENLFCTLKRSGESSYDTSYGYGVINLQTAAVLIDTTGAANIRLHGTIRKGDSGSTRLALNNFGTDALVSSVFGQTVQSTNGHAASFTDTVQVFSAGGAIDDADSGDVISHIKLGLSGDEFPAGIIYKLYGIVSS